MSQPNKQHLVYTSDLTPQTYRIQSVRIFCPYHSANNPFRRNTFHGKDSILKHKITYPLEYTNYKPTPIEEHGSEKNLQAQQADGDTQAVSINKINTSRTLNCHNKSKNQNGNLSYDKAGNTFDEEEEMFKEIQLNNAMSEIMEKELKVMKLLKPVVEADVSKQKLTLAPCKQKNTLILDLDETLIYSLGKHIQEKTYNTLSVITAKYAASSSVQFVRRPFLETFLCNAAKSYEIIVNAYTDIYGCRQGLR